MRSSIAIFGLAAVATAAKTVTEVVDVTVTSCAPEVTNCAYNGGSEWGSWAATTTSSKPSKETKASSTWADWDPSKPKTTTKASSTWGEWEEDPTKPKTTTKATASWEEWNNGKASTTSKPVRPATGTETWSEWEEPSKPKSTGKVSSASWEEWNSYKASTTSKPVKPATGTETWSVWESAKPSSTVNCPKYTETAAPTWLAALPSDIKSSLASKWSSTVPADWCYYSYSAIPQTVSTAKVPVATATGTSWAAWTPDATTKGPIATYTGAASKNAVVGLAGVAGLAALLL